MAPIAMRHHWAIEGARMAGQARFPTDTAHMLRNRRKRGGSTEKRPQEADEHKSTARE